MEKILSVSGLQKSYITKGNIYPALKGVSMEISSATRIFEITLVAIGLSLIVFLMRLIIFFFLQK